MIVAGIHLLKLSKLYNGKAVYKKKKKKTPKVKRRMSIKNIGYKILNIW